VALLSALLVWLLCGATSGGEAAPGAACAYGAAAPARPQAPRLRAHSAEYAPAAGPASLPADPASNLGAGANAAPPTAAPYADDAFRPSEATEEFYSTFKPQTLAQMMPSNWRPKGCASAGEGDEGQYSQFARYSISPAMVRRSESLRGMLRMQENTMTTNSKTLGMPNLLHNAVKPLRATPIGSSQFVFQDSQLRQGFIAAATGAYPEEPA
jgi:hypothetical protein